MKVICTEQGTPEWHRAHRGVISASEAHKALMGRHTKGRRLYVEKLADDLDGIPDFAEEDNPPWFSDGRYYESYARGWYSWKYGVDVRETGFVVHDDYAWIGCSPDGLVGDDGLVEIKFRKKLSTFAKHAQTMIPGHHPQCQTQIFVCGRDWNDYCNYWRDDANEIERGHVQRIYRDQAYIDNTLLPAFVELMNDVERLREQRELARQRRVS